MKSTHAIRFSPILKLKKLFHYEAVARKKSHSPAQVYILLSFSRKKDFCTKVHQVKMTDLRGRERF